MNYVGKIYITEEDTDVCVIFKTQGKRVHQGTSLLQYRMKENNLITEDTLTYMNSMSVGRTIHFSHTYFQNVLYELNILD